MKKACILLLIVIISACGPNDKPMIVNKDAVKKLASFKNESKFEMNTTTSYFPGLSDPKLKGPLSVLINKVADDFIKTTENEPTEKKFQRDIKEGLLRFTPFYLQLDTEDKEKVCHYFEDIMDCVGLQSSDGQLNDWIYGFDPNKK